MRNWCILFVSGESCFSELFCTPNLLRERSRNTGFWEWLKLENRPVFGSLKLKAVHAVNCKARFTHDLRTIYARFTDAQLFVPWHARMPLIRVNVRWFQFVNFKQLLNMVCYFCITNAIKKRIL